VSVPGGRVWYKVVGSGPGTPLLLLHGGPGATSHYLERLSALGDERPVIFYDQLGCGRSDRPTDTNLWQIPRFIEELQAVRRHLGLTRVHILGHSWGSMLATDYMLTQPRRVESLILASPVLSVPRGVQDMAELIKQLPSDVKEILIRHEQAGTTDSPEYAAADQVYLKRFLCRLDPWPPELQRALEGFGGPVRRTMWGPNELSATGWLKDYDRTSRLGELHLPVLFTAGRFDDSTPEATAWYRSLVSGSRLVIFEQSAHMTMLEETEAYVGVVRAFLRDVDRQAVLHR
jgi:proline iminopeptidase